MCEICEATSQILEAIFGHKIPPQKISQLIESSHLPKKTTLTQDDITMSLSIIKSTLKQLNKIPEDE